MIDIGLAGALLGGLLSLLSPCSVLLLPAFFAYAFGSPGHLLGRTGLFYLGLLTTLLPLGVLAASLGATLSGHRELLITVVAVLVIVAGALQLLGIPLPLPNRGMPVPDAGGALSAGATFLLGTVYAVAGLCAGPILGSVLLVASLGSRVYGALLMACYGLGMTLPLLMLALLWGRLGARGMAWLRPRQVRLRLGRFTWRNSWLPIISGVLTTAVGVLLLTTEGTAGLGGWLDVQRQAELEYRTLQAFSRVPDLVFVVAALVVAAAIGLLANRNRVEPGR